MAKSYLHSLPLTLIIYSAFLVFESVALGREANSEKCFSFSYASFEKNRSFYPEIGLHGGAEISNLTVTIARSGRLVYRRPIRFIGRNPGFSSYFSFSLSPINGADLGFFLTLSSVRVDLLDGPPPSVISVSFISSIGRNFRNLSENNLQIDVGGVVVIKSRNLSSKELVLNSSEKLHSWIDYYGTSNRLEVRLGKSRSSKPEKPIISYPIDLSNVLWREKMVVGFSSSSENSTQNCTLYAWTFAANHGAPYLMHSEPLDPSKVLDRPNDRNPSPHVRRSYPLGIVLALIFAAACGAMVTFFTLFVWFSVCAHRPIAPVEYPVHPAEVVYEKIVLVGVKDVQKGNK